MLDVLAAIAVTGIMVYGVTEFFRDAHKLSKKALATLSRAIKGLLNPTRRKKPKRRNRRRKSYIYIYALPDRTVKIGFSTVPANRQKQITRSLEALGMAPGKFIAVFPGTMSEEQALHARFRRYKRWMPDGVEGVSEWFNMRGDLTAWVRLQQQRHGHAAHLINNA